jgi:hypothetical protein
MERYGKPIPKTEGEPDLRFRAQGMLIEIHTTFGKCDFIRYTREGKPFSREEVIHLLSINKGDGMIPMSEPAKGTAESWVSEDDKMGAVLALGRCSLMVTNETGLKWLEQMREYKARVAPPKSLEGL